jgi:Tfp pilus assembly PilM family ATPase
MDNKKVGFEITIRGEKHIFSPEQVMGYYLKKMKTYFEKSGMNSKEIVISIPNSASNSER